MNSKESFLDFVNALKADKMDEDKKEELNPSTSYSDGQNGWVNDSISSFLESMHAFGSESDHIQLSWRSFAELLYAGKLYE